MEKTPYTLGKLRKKYFNSYNFLTYKELPQINEVKSQPNRKTYKGYEQTVPRRRNKLYLRLNIVVFFSPSLLMSQFIEVSRGGRCGELHTYGRLVWVRPRDNSATSIQVSIAGAQSHGTKHNYKRVRKCGLAVYPGRIWISLLLNTEQYCCHVHSSL